MISQQRWLATFRFGNTASGADALNRNTGGKYNTATGASALRGNTTGDANTANGFNALFSNSIGYSNTADGYFALYSNTGGEFNTANGGSALRDNTTGGRNTAIGALALSSNTTGNNNTAGGTLALGVNTTGSGNTAIGKSALANNNADNNTATGFLALGNNTTGNDNTATGSSALRSNGTGRSNTATGASALQLNTTGGVNTAEGTGALQHNTTGDFNTAMGSRAGVTATDANANTTGSNNTFIGYNSGPGTPAQLTNATAIGAGALVSANDAIVLGNSAVKAGIGVTSPAFKLHVSDSSNTGLRVETNTAGGTVASFGKRGEFRVDSPSTAGGRLTIKENGRVLAPAVYNTQLTSGRQLFVDPDGQLGYAPSSRRFKEQIQDMASASDGLLHLRPVTFYYKQGQQAAGRQLQYGLIAEEVEAVYPKLVEYSDKGEPLTVRYHLLAAMLLNELQKQHTEVSDLKAQVAELTDRLKELGR